MVKESPKVQFAKRWSSKTEAAAAIVSLIGDHDGKTAHRLKSVSNAKLLKLHAAGEELKSRFASRSGLEDAILKIKFPQGNVDETYKSRLQGYGVLRLLDLHRQLDNA